LSVKEKEEYLYWTAWKAAMLREKSSPPDDESEHDSDRDYEDEEHAVQLRKEGYYAVYFTVRRKKTFYVGSPVTIVHDSDVVKMKFLEKKLVNGTFKLDWPRREDVCTVEKAAILKEIHFSGPPPFTLSVSDQTDIEKAVKMYA